MCVGAPPTIASLNTRKRNRLLPSLSLLLWLQARQRAGLGFIGW